MRCRTWPSQSLPCPKVDNTLGGRSKGLKTMSRAHLLLIWDSVANYHEPSHITWNKTVRVWLPKSDKQLVQRVKKSPHSCKNCCVYNFTLCLKFLQMVGFFALIYSLLYYYCIFLDTSTSFAVQYAVFSCLLISHCFYYKNILSLNVLRILITTHNLKDFHTSQCSHTFQLLYGKQNQSKKFNL